jgi:hypothetical protein
MQRLFEWITICRACDVDPEAELAALARRIAAMVSRRRHKR